MKYLRSNIESYLDDLCCNQNDPFSTVSCCILTEFFGEFLLNGRSILLKETIIKEYHAHIFSDDATQLSCDFHCAIYGIANHQYPIPVLLAHIIPNK